jgi:hypothetical protein
MFAPGMGSCDSSVMVPVTLCCCAIVQNEINNVGSIVAAFLHN